MINAEMDLKVTQDVARVMALGTLQDGLARNFEF
jgi:hypothetical protein